MARARVVAEVGGLEVAADDLGDREDADEVAVLGQAGGQADEVLARGARDEVVELVRALGRIGPRPVQLAALAHHREEVVAVGGHELAQDDAAARARRQRGALPPAGLAAAAQDAPPHPRAPGGGSGAGSAAARRGSMVRMKQERSGAPPLGRTS